jgi:hypothetical protein
MKLSESETSPCINQPTVITNDNNTTNLNIHTGLNDLNINRELSLLEIIEKLKSLVDENGDITKMFLNLPTLKECITNIRKITCRQLMRDNKHLLDNQIHILLFMLLEHFQAENAVEGIEGAIIVCINIL